ncbi:hypothetical protein HK096_007431 [Nowakowskiella sp. JEL0078]|nr:hypothetical protein HK096_007431 [Nowakowskiella sp. JEL0078]
MSVNEHEFTAQHVTQTIDTSVSPVRKQSKRSKGSKGSKGHPFPLNSNFSNAGTSYGGSIFPYVINDEPFPDEAQKPKVMLDEGIGMHSITSYSSQNLQQQNQFGYSKSNPLSASGSFHQTGSTFKDDYLQYDSNSNAMIKI